MLWEMVRMWVIREEGQDLAEYGLILALIAVAAIAALQALSGGITSTLSSLTGAL